MDKVFKDSSGKSITIVSSVHFSPVINVKYVESGEEKLLSVHELRASNDIGAVTKAIREARS